MRNRQARYMVISFIVAAGAMLLADLIREQGELVVYFAEAFRYGAWYGFRQVGLYFLPGVLLILPITIYLLAGKWRINIPNWLAVVQFAFAVTAGFNWYPLVSMPMLYIDDWPMNIGGVPLTPYGVTIDTIKQIALVFWISFAIVHVVWLLRFARAWRAVSANSD